MRLNLPKIEEKILKFWRKNKIFQKSLQRTKKNPRFVFYEGPPFANGLPGIHHLLARAFKDVILRYKTMQGFFIERKAGWDTHGLPTEMEAEKKLGIKSKKEIEKLGIAKFIQECKSNVFTYKKEWEEFTERIGFWLDLKNAYITCSNDYIETLWWILKKIWQKGLLYQDYKVVPYCVRCGTSLSSHEVAQGYKTIKEPAIYLKFKIRNQKSKLAKAYLLVWTTTSWTLPGNVAIAVNPDFTYVKVKVNNEYLILAKERMEAGRVKGKIIEEFKGKDLIGLKYLPLFPIKNFHALEHGRKIYEVIGADFVSLEEGTGLVHIAPAFGEDDMAVWRQQFPISPEGKPSASYGAGNFQFPIPVDEEGKMKTAGYEWDGLFVKEADLLIIENLRKRHLLFYEEKYEHDYPFCWRCENPLLYYAKTSWFIKMTVLKKELIKNNQKINWIPVYLKEGRFGEWLRELKDWNLSRERYWGTPLPIWRCQTRCDNTKVIGSIQDLEKLSGKKVQDLHRPFIDKITFKCEKCGGIMKRVPEVIDCWFDSGSMPFGQWHYPFENKKRIDKRISFPADFICEGVDQTRGWFYTLLAISTLLNLGPAYKNVISHGIVLDAKGQKMSKSKGNVIWPKDVIDKYGADCARFYFYTINPVGEPKRFDFKEVEGLSRRFFDTLWNCQLFFETYGIKISNLHLKTQNLSLLDRWIISRLHNLNKKLVENLDKYYIVEAARLFDEFVVDDLSNWYIRRSRKRLRERSKGVPGKVLYYLLLNLAKLLAPFTPFIAEQIYQSLRSKSKITLPLSVHLCDYPGPNQKLIKKELERKMQTVREIVALVLAERMKVKIKVRQPLNELRIRNYELKKEKELLDLIKEEVNVKKVSFGRSFKLDTKITPQLKEEGIVREVIRQIQEMRKKAGLKPRNKILIYYSGNQKLIKIFSQNKNILLKETLAKNISFEKPHKQKLTLEKEMKIEEMELWLAIRKIVVKI